jgi:hypothetical protein
MGTEKKGMPGNPALEGEMNTGETLSTRDLHERVQAHNDGRGAAQAFKHRPESRKEAGTGGTLLGHQLN